MGTHQSTAVLNTNVNTSGGTVRHRAGVVISSLVTSPGLLHRLQNPMTSRATLLNSRSRPLRSKLRVNAIRQWTRSSLVEEIVGSNSLQVNLPVNITGLLSDQVKQVSTAVPASQRRKTPVRAQRGDDRVMRVESVVGGTAEVLGDGVAEENAVDAVLLLVGGGLVEGDQDEGVLGEVVVLQERGHEAVEPLAGESDVGVVGVVGHVGGDEHVLGQTVVLEVLVESGEVLDLARANGVVGDRVEEDEGVVLANVVVGAGLGVAEALVSCREGG